ncbi:MAG: hypothetical protein L0Y72_08910 [Gemmataceae bacterium]|nr:hypothetical protein [Gemmataceae bacterium]MCI0739150.1 hypothetical protein [Gemmataceae bacterium]
MEKYLCWSAMGISGLLLVVFILDFVIGIPFGGLSPFVSIVASLACALVFFLGWDAYQDVR